MSTVHAMVKHHDFTQYAGLCKEVNVTVVKGTKPNTAIPYSFLDWHIDELKWLVGEEEKAPDGYVSKRLRGDLRDVVHFNFYDGVVDVVISNENVTSKSIGYIDYFLSLCTGKRGLDLKFDAVTLECNPKKALKDYLFRRMP